MTHPSNPQGWNWVKRFSVLDKNGKPPEGLRKYFLARCILDLENIPSSIKDNENVEYQAVYNELTYSKPDTNTTFIEVIGSFQQWPEGNFVVFRADRRSK
jgi:hypothetical protein